MGNVIAPVADCNLHDSNAFNSTLRNNLRNHGPYLLVSGSTTYTQAVTFTGAGNVKGIFIVLHTQTIYSSLTRTFKVTLQEYVSGTWTDRLTVTNNVRDLVDESYGNNYGSYGVQIDFGGTYTVDTTAGKWRFTFQCPSGSGIVYLLRSDATNFSFSVYSDSLVSFADGDVPIISKNIDVTQACIFGPIVGGIGTTNNISIQHGSNRKLQFLEGASPYKATFRGYLLGVAEGEFRVGSEANPIPTDKQIEINFDTPTTNTGRYQGGSSRYQYKMRVSMYGATPTYTRTKLTEDANSGQKVLVVEDDVDWVAGDKVQITHADRTSLNESTLYTISTVVGKIITLTGNLTHKRLSGGTVCLFSRRGVKFSGGVETTSTTNHMINYSFYQPAEAYYNGVDISNGYYFLGAAGSGTWMRDSYGTIYGYTGTTKLGYENCSWYFTQAAYYYDGTVYSHPNSELIVKNNNLFRVTPLYSPAAYYGIGYKSQKIIFNDNIIIYPTAAQFQSTSLTTIECKRNIRTNANAVIYYLGGLNSVFEDNEIYGITGEYVFGVTNAIGYRGKNNTYNRSTGRLIGFFGYATVNNIEDSPIIDNITLETATYLNGALIDFTLKNPASTISSDGTTIGDTTIGSKLRIVNSNLTTNNDKVFMTYGNIQRCGDGLADTTVHTSGTGKFSIRFEPLSGSTEWEQKVPTGNIQGKTMTVSIWCKINSANYYSGIYVMPKLSVNYDDGTVLSCSASQNTDRQQLYVTFTPTTTAGEIIVTVSVETKQTGTDAYVYFDDMNIAYPAGYTLDLGGLDIWSNALPVTPSIATFPNLGGVRDELTDGHTIEGSFGKQATNNTENIEITMVSVL